MKRLCVLLFWLLSASAAAAPFMVVKNVSMRQAIDDLALAAANHDLVLVKVQPIDTALVKRGFEDPHVRIVFVGNETAVRWAEASDPRLLSFLPMRLTLVQRDEQIVVMSDDLTPWKAAFSDSPGLHLLKAWEIEIQEFLQDFERQ